MGVRLFERSRTGYAPTPAGEEVTAVAERVLLQLDELARRVTGQDVRATGVVRLTTTETLLEPLASILAELREAHPGIVVEIVTSNAFFTLTRRDADIALRPALRAPDGLVARRLAGVATAIYASRRYAHSRRGVDPLLLDWLAPDESLAHLGSARWIANHIQSERIVSRASSLTALLATTSAGMGVAPLPCFLADADPTLCRVMEPIPEMESALWLLTHPDLRRTVRVRTVYDALARGFTRHRTLLAGGNYKPPTPATRP
jgi:DNA-binding transcriptional LysR family regulator